RSPLFVDAELIDLAAGGALPLQLAVSSRTGLSTAVAAAIAEVAPREVCLARADLPPSIHQALVKRVADALGGMVVAKSWVTEARAALLTREATDRATVTIAAEAEAPALPAL